MVAVSRYSLSMQYYSLEDFNCYTTHAHHCELHVHEILTSEMASLCLKLNVTFSFEILKDKNEVIADIIYIQ